MSDRTKANPKAGTKVKVRNGDSVHVLFTGTLAHSQAPFAGWSRVIPAAPWIDLPPMYVVEEIES
jgi:hypothetical protein